MQRKIIAILLIITVIPILLLGWMGMRMSKNEHNVIKHQISSLNTSRLEKVDSNIAAYFSNLEKKFLADSLQISNDTNKFAQYLKNESLIKNGIIFDDSGTRLFPADGKLLTEKERIFIEKTKLFKEENISANNTNNQVDQQSIQQQSQNRQSGSYQEQTTNNSVMSKLSKPFLGRSRSANKPDKFGWYTWFSGVEQNHIFWWKNNGYIFGVELFHARLISDIIILLPTTSSSIASPDNRKSNNIQFPINNDTTMENSLIKLIDSNNTLIYQWGTYIPFEQEKYAAFLSLIKPLGSWRLEYYANETNFNPVFNMFNIVATLIAIGSILSGLAFYLYREHRREITLGKQRVNFVSQISHELKTPLTNIRMYAELLEEQLLEAQQLEEQLREEQQLEEPSLEAQQLEEQLREEQQLETLFLGEQKCGNHIPGEQLTNIYNADPKHIKHIKIISSESQRLSRLIANILNFSKSTKTGLNIHKTPGEIDQVISSVISKFEPLLTANKFVFDIQLNAKKTVLFDQDALEQILNNLLSNVEKYGASGKYLQICSYQVKDFTTITVKDNGPGIAAGEQGNVFKPFYRISSKLTDGISGTGIGLSIAKDLAILHGGSLKLVAFEPGACFKLQINTPAKT